MGSDFGCKAANGTVQRGTGTPSCLSTSSSPLSHEDVSRENDEAANGKCGMDADQYPGVPSLEDRGDKKAQADQCCQHDQRSSTYAEGGVSLIQPARRPDQR